MGKIAFVTTNKSAWGGSEYLWYQTAIRFSVSGHKVIAGIPRWKSLPGELDLLRDNEIKISFTTDVSSIKKIVNRVIPAGNQLSYKNDGYKFLLEFAPDLTVVNQGGNWGGIDLMEFCSGAGLKYVTISQAANEAKWPDDNSSLKLMSGLRKAEMNYYVSRANIKLTELQSASKIENAKIIFNPFNVSYSFEPPYPDVQGGFRIANVARHEFYPKGQDVLFCVLNEKKWRERNLIVSLYGKGEHSSSIKRLKDHFRLDKVKIEGHVSPEEIWKTNHALILASRYEGLPLALVEAMLCSRVPIVTSVSGNPEVITDNENGFLAKAATPEFLDEALERAWKQRDNWKEIGVKAGKSIREIVPADPIAFMYDEILSLGIIRK